MFVLSFTFAMMVSITIGHPIEGRDRNEPMCSKYDYEEKLLEKVIRMEIKMEKILEEVKDKERDITSISTNLLQRVENVENSAIQLKRDVNQTLVGFDDKFKEEKVMLSAAADKLSVPIIAFYVLLSSTKTLHNGDKVVFDTEITKQGGGYDKSTGIFTAPRTGVYLFSAHVCNQGDSVVQYSIYQEGTQLTRSTQYDKNSVYSCSSVNTVVMVNKDETIWVQCLYTSTFYTDSRRWNTFTGTLLHQQVHK